jgi:hypothetical protein
MGTWAPTPIAARLTKAQLQNTILDVLGVTVDDAALMGIPNDLVKETGFVTAVEAQPFSSAHVVGFSALAKAVVAQLDAAKSAQSVANCADTTAACGGNLVAKLGLKLFRRPLLVEETERFQGLFTTLSQIAGVSFEQVYRGLVSTMLQSPQFLYKMENETLGTPMTARGTTGYELASRLSFYLWQSAPDDALLQFAADIDAAGGTAVPAALNAQIDGMMADKTRFARSRDTFWGDYTHASTAAFADAMPDVAVELRQSVKAAFGRLSGDGAAEVPLQGMFTTKSMVMTPKVAELLGLTSMGPGPQVYDTSALPQRVGLLTHPGFLGAIGSVSFVSRGTLLSRRVLCREIPQPPPGIQEAIDDARSKALNLTPKGASEFRFSLGGPCLVCHQAFEPISYAFERFDVLGSYREKDGMGRDLFTAGYLQGPDNMPIGQYAGVQELMDLLFASEETSKCLVSNMLEFASGRDAKLAAGTATIDSAHTAFRSGGGAFSHLVRSIALAPSMQALTVLAPAP